MSLITKPMLAAAAKIEGGKILTPIKYPVVASPKYDGIRCLNINGAMVTRNFKPLPNDYIRTYLERVTRPGMDGEIVVYDEKGQMLPFSATGAIRRKSGEPNFEFHIFDYVRTSLSVPFDERLRDLEAALSRNPDERVRMVEQVVAVNEGGLSAYEERCLAHGFEGTMIRDPKSPYKCGRATLREGYLSKIKRFADAEAEVIGFEERMHNANEAKTNVFGRTERSSHKENKVPMGTLGALQVRMGDVEFNIGTGFDDAQRQEIWDNRDKYLGAQVTFKSQPFGAKDKPRFPVFKSFRWDK